MDGICAANFCKNITRRDPDHEATKMCSHLGTLFSHFAYVEEFFPDYFTDTSDEIEEEEHFIVSVPDSDAVILMLPVGCGNILHSPLTNQRNARSTHCKLHTRMQ